MALQDERLKKIRYAALRRGLAELEQVLGRFVEGHLEGLDPDQLDALERLLALDDLDLWEMILGRRSAPGPGQDSLLDLMRAVAGLPALRQS